MCTQLTEASNITNVYCDLGVLHSTGNTCYKSKTEDMRPEIIFGFCFEASGDHLIDKS